MLPAPTFSAPSTFSGFSFGGADSASTSGGFTFGGAAPAAGLFSFGGETSAPPAPSSTESSSASSTTGVFSFGANETSTFSALAGSGADAEFVEGEGGSFDSAPAEEAQIQSHAELFEGKTAEATGEENDTILLRSVGVSVFTLRPVADEPEKMSWSELGVGELHVNLWEDRSSGAAKKCARLVLRADKTRRLVLNVPLLPLLRSHLSRATPKQIQVASVDMTDVKKSAKYLLKVCVALSQLNSLLIPIT